MIYLECHYNYDEHQLYSLYTMKINISSTKPKTICFHVTLICYIHILYRLRVSHFIYNNDKRTFLDHFSPYNQSTCCTAFDSFHFSILLCLICLSLLYYSRTKSGLSINITWSSCGSSILTTFVQTVYFVGLSSSVPVALSLQDTIMNPVQYLFQFLGTGSSYTTNSLIWTLCTTQL